MGKSYILIRSLFPSASKLAHKRMIRQQPFAENPTHTHALIHTHLWDYSANTAEAHYTRTGAAEAINSILDEIHERGRGTKGNTRIECVPLLLPNGEPWNQRSENKSCVTHARYIAAADTTDLDSYRYTYWS